MATERRVDQGILGARGTEETTMERWERCEEVEGEAERESVGSPGEERPVAGGQGGRG